MPRSVRAGLRPGRSYGADESEASPVPVCAVRAAARCGCSRRRSSPYLPRQWAIIGNSLRSKYLWRRPAIEPAQAVVHHRPNCSTPPPWTAWERVRALGAHRRTTSQTGYPLDRTQHDLAGRLVAKNATLTRTRFRYDGQMTLDIRSMPFPKGQHMRGLRRAGKGLLSCLGLETTEVRPGAVAVSSYGREGRPRRR